MRWIIRLIQNDFLRLIATYNSYKIEWNKNNKIKSLKIRRIADLKVKLISF